MFTIYCLLVGNAEGVHAIKQNIHRTFIKHSLQAFVHVAHKMADDRLPGYCRRTLWQEGEHYGYTWSTLWTIIKHTTICLVTDPYKNQDGGMNALDCNTL